MAFTIRKITNNQETSIEFFKKLESSPMKEFVLINVQKYGIIIKPDVAATKCNRVDNFICRLNHGS